MLNGLILKLSLRELDPLNLFFKGKIERVLQYNLFNPSVYI